MGIFFLSLQFSCHKLSFFLDFIIFSLFLKLFCKIFVSIWSPTSYPGHPFPNAADHYRVVLGGRKVFSSSRLILCCHPDHLLLPSVANCCNVHFQGPLIQGSFLQSFFRQLPPSAPPFSHLSFLASGLSWLQHL